MVNRMMGFDGSEIIIKQLDTKKGGTIAYRSLPALYTVMVYAPKTVSVNELFWRAVDYIEERKNKSAYNYLSDGGYIYLFGKKKHLVVSNAVSDKLTEIGDTIYLEVRDDFYIRKLIKQYYTDALSEKIKEYLPIEESRTGIKCQNWSISDMISAWGKCYSRKKLLTFSLDLALFDVKFLKMVIIHELGHLVYNNHGKYFHAYMNKYCPQHRELSHELQG